jgi:transcriptional regulator with PAS, ATPase and Fis domain
LFLDEIAEMPINLQTKLLRAIEEKKIKLIGSEKEISVDVRIISATNKNIIQQIRENKFRLDLFHRINTIPIYIPPLRERIEDIECLLNYFLQYFALKKNKQVPEINKRGISILKKYPFPGNVRELRNMAERAVILSTGRIIDVSDLLSDPVIMYQDSCDTNLNIDNKEIDLILKALKSTNYNQNQAANLLGISRDSLIRRMKKHKITIQKDLEL